MKTLEFQWYIGGTAACMKITTKTNKECVQMSSKNTFFSENWFNGLKTEEEENSQGVYYCGPTKMKNKGFFKEML